MKRTILLLLAGAAFGFIVGAIVFHRAGPGPDAAGRKILYYQDPMNPQNTSPTPRKAPDGMDYVPVYAEPAGPPAGGPGIYIDPRVVQNIGVVSQPATKRDLARTIRTSGNVDFDQRKVFSVNARVMGWASELYADYAGQAVRKGQPLAAIYSPDLANTQQEYLQALNGWIEAKSMAGMEGMENMAEAGQEDSLAWASARQRLLNLGASQRDIDRLDAERKPLPAMTIVSPADGLIMEKMVVKGQNIMPGMELYRIADLAVVWVTASVYQDELPWVKVGQRADVELSYIPGRTFPGRVSFIAPMLDMETRTVQLRIEIANTPGLDIKPGMFATVAIKSPAVSGVVAVPEEAVIHTGERDVCVVDLGGGYFEPRTVKTGVYAGGFVQVVDGIKEGELVVVSSQFLIDAESNLKAAVLQMTGREETNAPAAAGPDTAGTPAAGPGMEMKPAPDTIREPPAEDRMGEMPGMDMGPKPDTVRKAHDMKNMGH